jgi:hypothetical protein
MANAKKGNVVDVQEDIMAEEQEVIVVEQTIETEKPAPKKAAKIKHDPSELIVCRSVVFGELFIIGPKTKMVYSWSNEGDIREMEYQDLMSLKALRHKYLFDPFIIIEDETLREEWKADLDPVYNKVESINLRDLFDLPQRQFVAKLKQLPESVKSSVQNMAYSMIKDGTLYDLRKINVMDEVLGTDLKMMI